MQTPEITRSQTPLLALAKEHIRALALSAVFIFSATQAHAQGCVAAHGSGLPVSVGEDGAAHAWDLSVSYRWFQSDRHFVGTTEHAERQEEGSQVINRSNFTDLGVNYTISSRYSISATIPYVSHDRSQTLRNNANVIFQRYHTQANGLGDISVVGNAWVFEPTPASKGNVQVGFGLALPTGKKDVRDTFQIFDRPSGTVLAAERTVDQSIQPGTGGYGIILSASGYRDFGSGFTGYANGVYTITPQERNGVPTFRGSIYEAEMSIADTYLGRAGVEYAFAGTSGISFSLGLRIEGVPVNDLVGGSKGFRRPGYSVAVEPGISITRPKWSARLYVPFAIQRDRQQSVPDKQRSAATGVYSQGDAAFADYLIAWSFSYRL